jgi:hypothetical protein
MIGNSLKGGRQRKSAKRLCMARLLHIYCVGFDRGMRMGHDLLFLQDTFIEDDLIRMLHDKMTLYA